MDLSMFNIVFKDNKLLEKALTHSSYANANNIESNEKLEFLGDAVLDLMMSTFLYENFENLDEGELTKKRAQNVCEKTFAECAKKINLQSAIKVAKGTNISESILADGFEALLGAIYLDGGLDECYKIIDSILFPGVLEDKFEIIDYKSTLQELVQAKSRTLKYYIINETGPSHNKTFETVVKMDEITMGTGIGKSKKESEQSAAKEALGKVVKI